MTDKKKDWSGSTQNVMATLNASSHSKEEREQNDYYATPPKAVEQLLKLETFQNNIWECACGEGYISKVLQRFGHNVRSTDLIDRGYGDTYDFLKTNGSADCDIITNPPFSKANDNILSILNSFILLSNLFSKIQSHASLFNISNL